MKNKNNISQDFSETGEQKSLRRTKIFILVFGIIAVVAVLASIGVAVAMNITPKPIDYLNDDLSKYLTLSEEDYKNFDIEVKVDDVSDTLINQEILKIVCQHKSKEPLHDGYGVKNLPIKAGDVVVMKYRGYTLDENGNKVDFTGGSDFNQKEFSKLEIGGGKFIPGFELALIGKNPEDYAEFKVREDGKTQVGDLVSLTYTAIYPDGKSVKDVVVMVDTGNEICDATYGEGFAEFLSNREIGKTFIKEDGSVDSKAFDNLNGMPGVTLYTDLKINKAFDIGNSAKPTLTIEVVFPKQYQDASLQGKQAYFDVYIKNAVKYETEELDETFTLSDKFVGETLKYTADDLRDFEGEGLGAKYKNMIIAKLNKIREKQIQLAVTDALWKRYYEKANVKKLPKADVKAYYNMTLSELKGQYDQYGKNYGSFDSFAATYLALNPGEKWEDALMKEAEKAVTQKLAFYYVVRENNFIPSEEEFSELYKATVADEFEAYLDSTGVKRSDFEKREDYDKKVEDAREKTKDMYSEDAMREAVNFDFAVSKLTEFVKIKFA